MKHLILGVVGIIMLVGLAQPRIIISQIDPIEATLTPFVPTSTPIPTQPAPTATPTIVIQPFPTAQPTVQYVYLPYVRKTIRSGE